MAVGPAASQMNYLTYSAAHPIQLAPQPVTIFSPFKQFSATPAGLLPDPALGEFSLKGDENMGGLDDALKKERLGNIDKDKK
jgi:hypothetical protein